MYSFSSFISCWISVILSVGGVDTSFRMATKARVIRMLVCMAISLLNTLASMMTPCSVKANGRADLGRLERYFVREQVQSIVERSKALERAEKANKRPKRAFEMNR